MALLLGDDLSGRQPGCIMELRGTEAMMSRSHDPGPRGKDSGQQLASPHNDSSELQPEIRWVGCRPEAVPV